jgi:hypothetical protein
VGVTPDAQRRATEALSDAFTAADIVCIGSPRELQELGDFLGTLVRDPAFASVCNDIVVEFGNRRYQETADRFLAGEEVPPAELLRIWRDTTQPGAWDSPVYGQLLVRVREANRTLPPERRLRVLLADPPIDWDSVKQPPDYAPFAAVREAHFAAVLEAEVLRKGRRAIFWAGASHVVRKPDNIPNPVVLIEKRGAGRTFVALTHAGFADEQLEDRLAALPAPSLLHMQDSWLGRLNAAAYFQSAHNKTGPNPYTGVRLQEAADAYLFLAPRAELTWTPAPEDIYQGAYGAEVARRRKLIAGLAGMVRGR